MCDGDVYEANIKDIDKKSDIATIKINPLVSCVGGVCVIGGDIMFSSRRTLAENSLPAALQGQTHAVTSCF